MHQLGRIQSRRGGLRARGLKIALVAVCALSAVTAVVAGGLGFLIYTRAHPARVHPTETPDALFTRYENATFIAPDGVSLSGWWIVGKAAASARERAPVVILCHDLGESRASFLGLATRLADAGYAVLLFDFRGHGESGGTSSFGTLEERDILGAIDWIAARRAVDIGRIGILGVGMGAHAAALAARDRVQIRCLVLDSPYADVGAFLNDPVPDRGFWTRLLGRATLAMYDLIYRVRSSELSASRQIPALSDRDLLFLVAGDNDRAAGAVRAMYESVPESRKHDKNLRILGATRATQLYGQDRDLYDQTVIEFFRSYLPVLRAEGSRAGRAAPAHSRER